MSKSLPKINPYIIAAIEKAGEDERTATQIQHIRMRGQASQERLQAQNYLAEVQLMNINGYALRRIGDCRPPPIRDDVQQIPPWEKPDDSTRATAQDTRQGAGPDTRREATRSEGIPADPTGAAIWRGSEKLSLKTSPLFGCMRWRFDSPLAPLRDAFVRFAWRVNRRAA